MSRRRTLLIVGCVVCLLALTSALPAADPRLDAPGVGSADSPNTGDWDTIVSDPDESPREEAGSTTGNGSELEITGALEPGNSVDVSVIDRVQMFEEYEILLNGEAVGRTDGGELTVTVPYAEEMTVEVPEESLSETFDVQTRATVETVGTPAQNREIEVRAVVGGTPVPGAELTQDGEVVGTTDDAGRLQVTMPERVGTTELSVERGPVAGGTTVELPAPEVVVTSPLLFPGLPASVEVQTNGAGVPNATVSALGGGEATTGDDGSARVQLPVDSEATIVTAIDGEQSTTTVGSLYLRMTVAFVLFPGLVIGFAWSYYRFVANRDPDAMGRAFGSSITGVFIGLAGAIANLLDSIRSLSIPTVPRPRPLSGGSGGLSWPSVPRPSVPSFSLPRPGASAAGSLLSGIFATSRGSQRRSIRSRLGFGRDDEERRDGATEAPSLAAEPLGPPEPQQEVRTLWHAFLDRIGVDRRETRTPGQVARRALAAGFPASQVRRLLGVFRRVEYGGRDPSPDRVAEARTATEELIDHDADEEGSE